ncbi:TraB/GumN family protein [Shewanella halotolerans]|uniref:TraB/GumN family protein n=1 Tax=Shewanella halotolerans TaxID=2864204 RepID=UPI001C65D10A|nr:TraB/GumN family protein [Shewanella halotolerans]QYJ90452.1 TraB/GumN family protein [Shewanella halotolerans]
MATSRPRLLTIGILLLTGIMSLSAMAAGDDKPPFYKITYQGKQTYLLGSIHIGQADFYPMAEQIEAAFAKSGALAVEADTNKADIMGLIRKYGLAQVAADAKTQTRLEEYCHTRREICTPMQPYAPWMQAMQFSVMRFASLGYQAQWGVDQMMLSKNGSRPVIELESTEYQFKLMASFSPQMQWDMVLEAIDAPDEEMVQLIKAWRSGDEAGLDALMQGQMLHDGDKELIDKMLWQRNEQMTAKIRSLMMQQDGPSPLFVVVGAGHVVGDKGIPAKFTGIEGAKVQNCWQTACN